MKLLTLNMLTCAVKACKSSTASFPLHPRDCELVTEEIEPSRAFIYGVLKRVEWEALRGSVVELGFPPLPEEAPTEQQLDEDEKMFKDLHTLLLETQIMEGSLVCGNCGHVYRIKEGIPNFLLPNHLV